MTTIRLNLLASARSDTRALLGELAPTPLVKDRELCLQLSRLHQLAHELWRVRAVSVEHATQLRELGAWFLNGAEQPGEYGLQRAEDWKPRPSWLKPWVSMDTPPAGVYSPFKVPPCTSPLSDVPGGGVFSCH